MQLELFNRFNRLTMGEAIPIFHDIEGRLKSRCYKYQYKPILEVFRNRPLDEITYIDVENYRRKRELDGLRGSGINREHSVITRIFNALKEWKKLGKVRGYDFTELVLPGDNPGEEVKKADERKYTRKVVLKPAQFMKFCNYAHPEVRKICTLAVLTLLRKKNLEILNQDNLNSTLDTLQGQQTKTQMPFNVPASLTVTMLIDNAPVATVCDFTNFRRRFERARKESGVYFQFRDLRRTGATTLLLEGIDIRSIQIFLGHADISTTMKYLQPAPENLKEAANKLEEKFSFSVGEKKG